MNFDNGFPTTQHGSDRPMTTQEAIEYRVELDAFSGPLDLLLYLVRRQEVDVLNLPIAEIAGRFLEFLEVLQVLDLDLIGDFVVMASSLVEIKSRMALPGPDEPPELVEPDEDPAPTSCGSCWNTSASRTPRGCWRIRPHSGSSAVRG